MAEETSPSIQPQPETGLKYLEFVQAAALHAVICTARLYSYAKENLGPLKPGVETVEGTVKAVVGPVYDKVHCLPGEVLKFVDRKVDDSVHKIEAHVPPSVKQAPSGVRSVVADVKTTGVIGTASTLAKSVCTKYEPAAKGLYLKYELVAEQYASSAWRSLNHLPLFPKVARAMAPTASYLSERYNQTVQVGSEKGYKVTSYLPLVPTAKIARLLSPVETS